MTLGYNTAGTEETFERILGESAGRAAEQNELFVYLEIGIAEGTTLLSVAYYLKALTALGKGRFNFAWNAIGLDLYGGPFFDPQRFVSNCVHHNLEILYNGNKLEGQSFSVRNNLDIITVALLPEDESVANQKFPPSSIDFCVIDGCHGAPCVERDFLAIERAIKPGGIVAFHDAMPEDQGGEPGTNGWQSHCGTGTNVIAALEKLGLATERLYWEKKGPGWEIAGAVKGDKSRGGNGFAFFRKV